MREVDGRVGNVGTIKARLVRFGPVRVGSDQFRTGFFLVDKEVGTFFRVDEQTLGRVVDQTTLDGRIVRYTQLRQVIGYDRLDDFRADCWEDVCSGKQKKTVTCVSVSERNVLW